MAEETECRHQGWLPWPISHWVLWWRPSTHISDRASMGLQSSLLWAQDLRSAWKLSEPLTHGLGTSEPPGTHEGGLLARDSGQWWKLFYWRVAPRPTWRSLGLWHWGLSGQVKRKGKEEQLVFWNRPNRPLWEFLWGLVLLCRDWRPCLHTL